MFDTRGAVLLTPPGWDEPDPPDLGDWEPIPEEVWREAQDAIPEWPYDAIAFHDRPVDDAVRLPLGAHTYRLLTETPVTDLSPAARAWALKRAGELISHLEGFRAELVAAIAGPAPADRTEDFAAHEVALATKCGLYAADRDVALARDLAGRLSATREAMAEGRVTQPQARALRDGVAHLPDELAREIEARMLRFAHRQDLTLFKASLRKWLARLDPSWKTTAETARRQVRVEHTRNDDGTGELFIRGPLELTSTLDTALNAYAAASKSQHGGTSAARKLTGLTHWAETYLTSPDAPRRHGRAITITLCLDPPTLFGLAQHPVEIPGYGMIPAEAALHLLADGSPLRRLLIDPDDGHLLHYGRTTYTVPPALAEHLAALHHTSAAPHATVPAAGCDLDHNQPYDHGGTTDPDNLTPLDRRWHRAKTHAGWTYQKNKNGTIDWTSPSGLTQRVDPHDYRLGP